MAARSKRLLGPAAVPVSTSSPLIATVPAGKRWLVKDLRVVGTGTPSGQVIFGIGGLGAAVRVRVIAHPAAQTTDVDPSTEPLVMNAGEELHCRLSGTTGGCTVTVSGVELEE